MALTTIRKVASFVVLAMAIGAIIASWVVLERPYGTMGAIAAGIAPFIALFVVLGIIAAGALAQGLAFPYGPRRLPAFTRKPLQSSNYPRIEHLRIAGKYQVAGRFAEVGISPLHLGR